MGSSTDVNFSGLTPRQSHRVADSTRKIRNWDDNFSNTRTTKARRIYPWSRGKFVDISLGIILLLFLTNFQLEYFSCTICPCTVATPVLVGLRSIPTWGKSFLENE